DPQPIAESGVTPPRLEACYFGDDEHGVWRRLAAVLEATAAEHCQGWQVTVRKVEPEQRVSALGVPSHARNTEKMDEWHRIALADEIRRNQPGGAWRDAEPERSGWAAGGTTAVPRVEL